MNDLRPWPLRAAWATLPLTLGPLLAHTLDPRSSPVRTGLSLLGWAAWAAVLVASLVPRPVTLTVVRIAVPASVPFAVWASILDGATWRAALGTSAALVATACALVPANGDVFVDGSSYGDERRMPLRVPGPVLLGPLELAWTATVVGVTAGPMLLLARAWVAGIVAVALGAPLAALAARALHTLTRRWVVFVPAGIVLHDHLALREPTLFPRTSITGLSAATAEPVGPDLTVAALGLALQLGFTEPMTIAVVPRRGERDRAASAPIDVNGLVFAPTRPGAVLAEARERRIPVR
jgi:hypothetical protein